MLDEQKTCYQAVLPSNLGGSSLQLHFFGTVTVEMNLRRSSQNSEDFVSTVAMKCLIFLVIYLQ